MKPTYTFREARVLQSARELQDKCDLTRARRTDPTPLQQHMARMNWYAPTSLLTRLSHLFTKPPTSAR